MSAPIDTPAAATLAAEQAALDAIRAMLPAEYDSPAARRAWHAIDFLASQLEVHARATQVTP